MRRKQNCQNIFQTGKRRGYSVFLHKISRKKKVQISDFQWPIVRKKDWQFYWDDVYHRSNHKLPKFEYAKWI